MFERCNRTSQTMRGIIFYASAERRRFHTGCGVSGRRLVLPDGNSTPAASSLLCLIVAPYGGHDAMIADLKEKVFPGKEIFFLGISEGQKRVKRL